MRAELKSLQRQLGTTMVYVTHDQTEAMTMGDKIVVLNHGRIEQFGTPEEIYAGPNSIFVAKFLGSPSMNLIRGEITQVSGNSLFTALNFQTKLPPMEVLQKKEVFMGIRPEVFSVDKNTAVESFFEIKGALALAEKLGSSTNYYMDSPVAEEGRLTASIQATAESDTYRIGEEIVFRLTSPQIHLFDIATGKRIIM
jgi:ABC-type sugar transport system ATPase subunit